MFIAITLTQPNGSHTVKYFGDRYPIGGSGAIVLRIADIRSAHPANGCTLVMMLDRQQYAVAETPEEIFAKITASLPVSRAISDHALMGNVNVSGKIETSHTVSGRVDHVAPLALAS